jgi:DNA-binding response OmpR family regulator
MKHVILIVEDEPEMAQFMQDILVEHDYQVLVETKGTAALEKIERIEPDMVLLDLMLPDIEGGTVCKHIKEDFPNIIVIMITAQGTPEDMAKGLNLGADDYIPKPITPEVLLARVKARFRADGNQAKKLVVGDLSLDSQKHEVKRAGEHVVLSPQEFKLLEYFMSNPGRVLTREMILSRIWRGSPEIETRVIDVYVGYLRKKLEKNQSKLFRSVRGFGYMLMQPEA